MMSNLSESVEISWTDGRTDMVKVTGKLLQHFVMEAPKRGHKTLPIQLCRHESYLLQTPTDER